LGDKTEWDSAEKALEEALNHIGAKWTLNPGDGAFYGPKIDIRLKDALKRWHQCGTIQLDFQLPRRFNLHFRTEDSSISTKHPKEPNTNEPKEPEETITDSKKMKNAPLTEKDKDAKCTGSWGGDIQQENGSLEQELKPGFERPVMIHRAILGSIERMTAILIEHTAGRLPFWLSPRQIVICTITEKANEYGSWLKSVLHDHGYFVSLDDGNHTINKKVRNAELERWNYIIVIGQDEAQSATVTIRESKTEGRRQMSVPDLMDQLRRENMPSSRVLKEYNDPPKFSAHVAQ